MSLTPSPRIFVSYARGDGREAARELRRRLIEDHDLAIWQDLADLEGGRDWWHEIERVVRDSNLEYLVLVMTPKALQSDVVRKEWRLARQEGKCVVPVIGSRELNFSAVPAWMRKSNFVDVEQPESWERFVLTLKGPCQSERVAYMAPDLPGDFIQRPKEYEALVEQLLGENQEEPLAITAALQGAGGFGKTTLATAICHDERVQDAFHQGILWITLGEKPGDLTNQVVDLIETISGEAPSFNSVGAASTRLAELLADNTILLVIDDVWDAAHLKPFVKGGTRCTRLITTRNSGTLPLETRKIRVDSMATSEAVELLKFGLPKAAPDQVRRLVSKLGEWPLLLKLVNGVLRTRVRDTGQSLPAALSYVERALERRSLTAFDVMSADDRNSAVAATLGVSLDMLTENERARFSELAIFPEDARIPLETVERLWQGTAELDDLTTEELCTKLFGFSLLLELDLATRYLRLHDVVRSYLETTQRERKPELHAQFLEGFGVDRWPELPESEPYLWHHLCFHIANAERWDELRKLLLDFDWIAAKLRVAGVNALLADYDYLGYDQSTRLIQGTLRLSANGLAKHGAQLAGQLIGRLRNAESPVIQAVLEQGQAAQKGPWLRPLKATLTPPGGSLQRTLVGHTYSVNCVVITPDGSRTISAASDNTLKVWDLESGDVVQTLKGHTDWVLGVEVTPDGSRAVSASQDHTLKVWDLASGDVVHSLKGHWRTVTGVAVTSDGRCAVSASYDGTLRVWNFGSGDLMHTLEGHANGVNGVAVTPDGRRAISASYDRTLKVWDLASGDVLHTLDGHTRGVNGVVVTPDGCRAVSASDDKTLKVWDVASGNVVRSLEDHTAPVIGVAVTPDGRCAVSASYDRTLKVWDLASGDVVQTLEGHTSSVNGVAVTPDGRCAISASEDATLKVWDLESGDVVHTRDGHTGAVRDVVVTPDGRCAISASEDATLKVWDLESGDVVRTLEGHTSSVNGLAVTPDGGCAVSASYDDTLKVWDLASADVLQTLEGHTCSVNGVAVTPDGCCAISASDDATVMVWDLTSGEVVHTLVGHTDSVQGVAVTSDGRCAISASSDKTLKVWDLARGDVVHRLKGHSMSVTGVALTPDGRRAISAFGDTTVKVWDLASGDVVHTLEGHKHSIIGVAVAPDGQRAVSAFDDRTLKVWDLASGDVAHTLKGHTAWVTDVVVTPDGKRAVSASWDRTLKVWDLANGDVEASFTVDGPVMCCAVLADSVTVVGGDKLGQVHFLRLQNSS